jgi:hypothetical protein
MAAQGGRATAPQCEALVLRRFPYAVVYIELDNETTRRYGRGSYRVSAYGFEPTGVRWEVLIEELA